MNVYLTTPRSRDDNWRTRMIRRNDRPFEINDWLMTPEGVGILRAQDERNVSVQFTLGSRVRLFERRQVDFATPAEFHVSSARRSFAEVEGPLTSKPPHE